MKNTPLISVIVTDYNYGNYIMQCIESVLAQTYPNIELIVINDGSTDNSDEIIKECVAGNPTIHYVNQKNAGANKSRNRGIGVAKGQYVFCLDADNWLNPGHINSLYRTSVKNNADVVYGDLQYFGNLKDKLAVAEFDIDLLKIFNFIDTSSLIKKKSIKESKFDVYLNRKVFQDWDFFLGLALRGVKIVKDTDVSLNHRVHDKQNGSSFSSIKKIDELCEAYSYITKKYADQYPDQFGVHIKFANDLFLKYADVHRALLRTTNDYTAAKLKTDEYVATLEDERAATLNSLSWRITAPLRLVNRTVEQRVQSLRTFLKRDIK